MFKRSLIVVAACAAAASGLVLRPPAPGDAAQATSAPSPAAVAHRLRACVPYVEEGDDEFDRAGADYLTKEFGGTVKGAKTWIRIQALTLELIDAVETGPFAADLASSEFDYKNRRVRIYMRNRLHNDAVRRCARELDIAQYVRIGIRRYSTDDLGQAAGHIIETLPTLFARGLFETSSGTEDRLFITVKTSATNDEVNQIKQAALATGVPYKITRSNH